jgi:hypothetical protein
MNKEPYERLHKSINKQNHKNKAQMPGGMSLSKPEAAVAMAAG